jgi:RNA polymerase sigma-70 factor (ECF subfamily)
MQAEATTMTETADVRQQFHDLLEQHRKVVFKVANTYCRDPHDRADLAQDIVTQSWRAFPRYDAARSFSTWLYRIALNVAISSIRTTRLRDAHAVALDDELHDIGIATPDAHTDERIGALYRVIDRLDPLNRALLLLYLDEKSYREIAEILGLSETNVATKIGRLKQRLREDLADHA